MLLLPNLTKSSDSENRKSGLKKLGPLLFDFKIKTNNLPLDLMFLTLYDIYGTDNLMLTPKMLTT